MQRVDAFVQAYARTLGMVIAVTLIIAGFVAGLVVWDWGPALAAAIGAIVIIIAAGSLSRDW